VKYSSFSQANIYFKETINKARNTCRGNVTEDAACVSSRTRDVVVIQEIVLYSVVDIKCQTSD
jgi:hypothetical protein